jgi:hypothetical protein
MKHTNLSIITPLTENRVGYMTIPGISIEFTSKEIKWFKFLPIEEKYRMVSTAVCEVILFRKQVLDPPRLLSKDRYDTLPIARYFCMYYLYTIGGASLNEIARLLRPEGKKPMNHTSVIHGREQIKNALKPTNRDPFSEQLREYNEQIIPKIKQRINESSSTHG